MAEFRCRHTHFALLCGVAALSVPAATVIVMARHVPLPFSQGVIEEVAKIVGGLYSGSELTRILDQVGLSDPLGSTTTKWRRLASAMQEKQECKQDGGAVVGLIHAAMAPERTLSRRREAAIARDNLTQVLSIAGYRVKDDGRIAMTARSTTDSEAAARSARLHKLLSDLGAHQDVLRHCRPELVRTDFYEAVFESIKGLGHRLREISGRTDEDGPRLVEATLEGSDPLILLNNRANQSQRDEQRGVALLMKGIFAAFRNPAAHEPKIVWTMTEQDALDVLGTLSMVHRRLDAARLTRR